MKILANNKIRIEVYVAEHCTTEMIISKHDIYNIWKVSGRNGHSSICSLQLISPIPPQPSYNAAYVLMQKRFPNFPNHILNDIGPYFQIPEKEYEQLLTLQPNNPKVSVSATHRINGINPAYNLIPK